MDVTFMTAPRLELTAYSQALTCTRTNNETIVAKSAVNEKNVLESCCALQDAAEQKVQLLRQVENLKHDIELSFQPMHALAQAINQYVRSLPDFSTVCGQLANLNQLIKQDQLLPIMTEWVSHINTFLSKWSHQTPMIPCLTKLAQEYEDCSSRIKSLLLSRAKSATTFLLEWFTISRCLDLDFQEEFDRTVIQVHMSSYRSKFPKSAPLSAFDLQARFDVFERMMSMLDGADDKFMHRFTQEFCRLVREMLSSYLINAAIEKLSMAHIVALWQVCSMFEKKSTYPLRGLVTSAFVAQVDDYLEHEKQKLRPLCVVNVVEWSSAPLLTCIKRGLETARVINLPGGSILCHLLKIYTNAIFEVLLHLGNAQTFHLRVVNLCEELTQSTLSLLNYFSEISESRDLVQIDPIREQLWSLSSESVSKQLHRHVDSHSSSLLQIHRTKPECKGNEHSEWVREFGKRWSNLVGTTRIVLSDADFTSFMVLLVKKVMKEEDQRLLHGFGSNMWARLKNQASLNEEQAAAWLLDIYALRDVMVRQNENTKSRFYYQTIEASFSPLIAKLQILSSSVDHFVSSFRLLGMSRKEDASLHLQTFKRLMNLRGFSKDQQRALLEQLNHQS